MRVALAAHDEVLRGTIAHKGLIFATTGDGVCAVFALPRSAVDAAAAQRALEVIRLVADVQATRIVTAMDGVSC